MATNRLVFTGLEELKAALRALPADLTSEASQIVLEAGTDAAATVRGVYDAHVVSGRLAKSVTVAVQSAGQFGAAVVVKVNDPIAWLFDNGSQARHYFTVHGVQHNTGEMGSRTPPTHIFSGTMARRRRRMYQDLRTLLETHGLLVRSDAG